RPPERHASAAGAIYVQARLPARDHRLVGIRKAHRERLDAAAVRSEPRIVRGFAFDAEELVLERLVDRRDIEAGALEQAYHGALAEVEAMLEHDVPERVAPQHVVSARHLEVNAGPALTQRFS